MIRNLITDEDILSGRVTSPIVLDADTLLTPAARDRAVIKGMVIVEKNSPWGEPPMPGQRADVPPGLAAPRPAVVGSGHTSPLADALSDGLYLVRVEGGRLVSCLPAAGAGQLTRAKGAAKTP